LEPVTIGILGCGKQAEKHISGYAHCENVRLVLSDIDTERARDLAGRLDLAWVETSDDIFANREINAVDICSVTASHMPLISQAIEADKHFFVEKPLCQRAEDAARICEQTRAAGLIGRVGYVYRHVPMFRDAKRILGDASTDSSNALGRLMFAFMRIGGRGSHALWKHRRESDGGAVSEMLVHMLDLALWYFGPIGSIEVLDCGLLQPVRSIDGVMHECDAPDFVAVKAVSATGVRILIQADMVTPAFTQFMEIQGSKGSLVCSIDNNWPNYIFCKEAAGGMAAGRNELDIGRANFYVSQMTEFVGHIRGGKSSGDAPPDTTLDTSVELHRLLEAINEDVGLRFADAPDAAPLSGYGSLSSVPTNGQAKSERM